LNQKVLTNFPNAPDIESSTWDYSRRFDGPVGAWMLQQQVAATATVLEKSFSEHTSLKVLDVGGGHGQNIELLSQLGHKLTIVGSSESCVEVIKGYIVGDKVKFVVSPLLQLPYEDNSFDVVICYRILSHMESWKELIAELTRVAKHLVLVDYPTTKSVNIAGELFFWLKKKVEGNTRRYGCFMDKEIDSVFGSNHFYCIYQHKQFFLPMALHRVFGMLSFSKSVSKIFRIVGLTRFFGSPSISGYRPR